MIAPALVYISQPTEYGTLYSLKELEALSAVCRKRDLKLFVDGACLAYALASPANDVTLADLARLTDVFYIGGTKCGALFGEAVVIPERGSIRQFVTQMKQHSALLAKGRLLGVQFEALFEDDLYVRIGAPAVEASAKSQPWTRCPARARGTASVPVAYPMSRTSSPASSASKSRSQCS